VTYAEIARWRRAERRRRLIRKAGRYVFMFLAGVGLAILGWIVLLLALAVLP
jgi:hypothetical protein